MRISKYLAAIATASLVVAPAMAAPANPAASLSLGKTVRASSTSKHKNGLLGGGTGILVAVVAAAAVGVGAYVGVDNKDDKPSSP